MQGVALLDHTKAMITRALGVEIVERVGDAYRSATGELLEGEWIGAFAQPSVILRKVTATSLRIDGRGGAAIDEYGESKLHVASTADDRVELIKQYVKPPQSSQPIVYVGRLQGSTFAGFWYAQRRPQFSGVFWMIRADRLSDETLAALRKHVRSRSVPRAVLQGAFIAGSVVFGIATVVSGVLTVAMIAIAVGFVALVRHRVKQLRAEASQWKQLLG